MLSKKATQAQRLLVFMKPVLEKADVDTCRKGQDLIGRICAREVAGATVWQDMTANGVEACMVTPANKAPSSKVILYLHGGGYTAGSLEYARGFGCLLSARTGLCVLCAAYRLAPEHPFPAAVEDAVAVYDYLINDGFAPNDIILTGESAGGGLVFALTLALKAAGKTLPRAIVALSPWTDLTFSGESYTFNVDVDPSLSEPQLRYYAKMYAPGRYSEPLVSPLFGDVSGFPPSLIIVGGDEILLDDSRRMADKLRAASCRCDLYVQDGMWHVFELYGMPESEHALTLINEFVKEMAAQ